MSDKFLEEMARIFYLENKEQLLPSVSTEDIDSLGRTEIVHLAEDYLGISMNWKEVDQCKTWGEIKSFLNARGAKL